MLKQTHRLAGFLLPTSLGLWFYSVSVAELRFGQLGLISSLPPTFFLATALLTASFILSLRSNSRSLLIIHIVLFIVLLHLTPALLETTPRFVSVYSLHGDVDYVLRYGKTDPSLSYYQVWSGGVLLASALINATGIGSMTLFLLAPLILQLVQLAAVYYLLSQLKLDWAVFWLALWSFFVFDWLQDYTLLPQNIALRLFVFGLASLLLLVFKATASGASTGFKEVGMVLIFFSATVVSHPFTMVIFFASLVLVGLFVGRKRFAWLGLVVSLALGFSSLWFLYGNRKVFDEILKVRLMGQTGTVVGRSGAPLSNVPGGLLVGLVDTLQSTLAGLIDPFIRQPLVNVIRLSLGATVLVLTLVGLALLFRRGGRLRRLSLTILAVLFGGGSTVLVGGWGIETVSRVYEHVLPLTIVPVSLILTRQLKAFAIFLILMAPALHYTANYGNESVEYISGGELKVYDFAKSSYVPSPKFRTSKVSLTSFSWELASYRVPEDVGWVNLRHYLQRSAANSKGQPIFEAEGNHYLVESEREIKGVGGNSSGYSVHVPLLTIAEWFDLIRSKGGYDKVYTTGGYGLYRIVSQPMLYCPEGETCPMPKYVEPSVGGLNWFAMDRGTTIRKVLLEVDGTPMGVLQVEGVGNELGFLRVRGASKSPMNLSGRVVETWLKVNASGYTGVVLALYSGERYSEARFGVLLEAGKWYTLRLPTNSTDLDATRIDMLEVRIEGCTRIEGCFLSSEGVTVPSVVVAASTMWIRQDFT